MKKSQYKNQLSSNLNLAQYIFNTLANNREKGFVLPLSMMLLLVLSLSVTSILVRSGQQSEQVLTTRENKKVYNAASPAMERAKAKIEYYFDEDAPTGEPPGAAIEFKMLGKEQPTDPVDKIEGYTLPDEQRLDINGDGKLDNAWAYETDVDGDGNTETVAYSIMMKTEANNITIADSNLASKAANLVTRSGPLNITASSSAGSCAIPELQLEGGWYKVNESSIRKNFQINTVVASKNTSNRNIVAMEFQQDRQLDRGNKWAAWFRYDLELFPGPDFNWNGAVHTAGNLMVGQQSDKINFHLISSPKSCLYTEDASEITMAEYKKGNSDDIEFQGQVMAFSSTANTFSGNARVYLYPGAGKKPATPQTLDNGKDSVKNTGKPYDYSLNPIVLFTEDKSLSRNNSDTSNVSIRDPNWAKNPINKRIFNKLQKTPYVDDTYRADDRYGPKPRYNPPTSNVQINVTAANNGTLISEDDAEVLTKNNVAVGDEIKVGLDGYWERRARLQGLRLIVGERLELGNFFGWGGNNDPLYPINNNGLDNENRQRKTLRDNLAAVQSLAIYHQGNSDKDFPVACMAFTAHPGTATTITNSTTFSEITVNGQTRLNANFLTGTGTNGWEFNAPGNVTSSSSFASLINSPDDPLRVALTNLAYFAGDPDGAFPPKQEAGGNIIHPYPQLTMWGNYSNLRRVINRLDAGVDYDDLSIADQTTLHTASCNLGMLAYNVRNIEEQEKQAQTTAENNVKNLIPGMQAFATHLWQLVDDNGISGSGGNGEVNQLKNNPKVNPPNGYNRYGTCANASDLKCATNFYAQFGATEFEQAIQAKSGLNSTDKTSYIAAAQALVNALKTVDNLAKTRTINDDRSLGFQEGSASGLKKSIPGDIDWDPVTGHVTLNEGGNKNVTFKTACDPDLFDSAVPGNADKAKFKIALAMAFCSPKDFPPSSPPKPKYPSLYYLFPKNNHDHDGTNFDGSGNMVTISQDDQPTTEEYIADTYIQGINSSYTYRVINDSNNNGTEDVTENLSIIELRPRSLPNSSLTSADSWRLPYTTSNTNINNRISSKGSSYYVPFLDKGVFNGRELINTRVLDIDLNLLRNNDIGADVWLPKTGMVYAFREDAVREDMIARPSNGDWSTCGNETALTTGNANCRMNVNARQDPPRNSATGVSPKSVDFYPDPERRPHGFRLRNGRTLVRSGDRGLSFISDQPVYIQGNFNLHTSNGTNLLEEFTQLLPDSWSNFYDRSTLDTNFAKPSKDNWRPSEIIADAVSILSDNFCDGAIEDGFKGINTNCPSGGNSSYRNYTIKPLNNNTWNREDGTTTNTTLPIYVDRNGFAWRGTTQYFFNTNNYNSMNTNRTVGTGVDGQRVNAIIVSGLIPSRPGSSYGGLHNFPRFLENWSGQNLYIAGSMIQLNFSSYATGLFDQEKQAWEPGGSGQNGESLPFYGAPNRRWGYDVALQYNPPGPVAARFVSQGTPRSEFYRELPIDDPYAKQLRCAVLNNGNKVDLNATDCN